jgi:hypothetical protein
MRPTFRFQPIFGALLVAVAVQCVHSAPLYHLPTSIQPAAKYLTSMRGGAFYGGKAAAKRPPASNFLDAIASAAGEKVSDDSSARDTPDQAIAFLKCPIGLFHGMAWFSANVL